MFGFSPCAVMGSRPYIVLMKARDDLDGLEFLKIVLREIYRVRTKKGKPFTRHIEESEGKLRYDISIGDTKPEGRIYVIDLTGIHSDDGVHKVDASIVIRDRIRELISQHFGFLIIVCKDEGDTPTSFVKIKEIVEKYYPRYFEFEPSNISASKNLLEAMWGFVCEFNKNDKLDSFAIKADMEYYSMIEKLSRKYSLIVKQSPEDEESLGAEFIMHYGMKAYIVEYLNKSGEIPLENIYIETPIGSSVSMIPDIYIDYGGYIEVYEVETLYGTVLPSLKIRNLVEQRMRFGNIMLNVVFPNIQAVLFFGDLYRILKYYRKVYGDRINFYTLDTRKTEEEKSRGLISFDDLKELLKKSIINFPSVR